MLGNKPHKATRASAPKSRHGCLTCKHRRVKCDETKPNCRSCRKSSRSCHWNPETKPAAPKPQRAIRPQTALHPQGASNQLSRVRPSEALQFIDQSEAYYFYKFQQDTSRELSGFRKSTAWTQTMLQSCHSEPFVLRSLVAIGALDKSIKMSHAASVEPQLHDNRQLVANQHRQFALATYDKAIIGMRRMTPDLDQPAFLRKTLIACLLVNCIESYLQDPNTACLHAQAGYDLLHRWVEKYPHKVTGLGSPNSSIIEDDIYSEFARQDLSTALRLMTIADSKPAPRPGPQMQRHGTMWGIEKQLERHQFRRREGTPAVQNMPASFSSIDEARNYLELILRRTFHLVGETFTRIVSVKSESGHAYTADSPGELIDPCHVPEMLLEDRDGYIQDIRRWCKAFDPILDSSLASVDTKISMGAALLRIHALGAEISLAGTYFTQECSFDEYFPDFSEIVELSRFVVQTSTENSPKLEPVFNLDIGIEKGLYSTSLYCRDKTIRHEALHILRSQAYRDATYNICRMVARASFIVDLEEKGRQEDGRIPEDARYRRIWLLNHHFEESRNLTIMCARRVGYPLGEAYPAKREWRLRTWTQAELESIAISTNPEYPLGQDELKPWPSTLRKPGCVKWAEIHSELLRTVRAYPPD
ncbi:hypothetical protein LARI1_G002100 [Lachnellula arida]|uniref:Zn(2)-C6 fungal-type domain-containing protein n=1 Tax=Lachnellula arida TaxID=1316785 RepID=A0A8T9BJS4_9HELO|nr:hypothetical protein LARI1_G002100 [Lachnellula arida]